MGPLGAADTLRIVALARLQPKRATRLISPLSSRSRRSSASGACRVQTKSRTSSDAALADPRTNRFQVGPPPRTVLPSRKGEGPYVIIRLRGNTTRGLRRQRSPRQGTTRSVGWKLFEPPSSHVASSGGERLGSNSSAASCIPPRSRSRHRPYFAALSPPIRPMLSHFRELRFLSATGSRVSPGAGSRPVRPSNALRRAGGVLVGGVPNST